MSVELIAAGSALVVAVAGGIFNYYKLQDDQKTWEHDKKISLNKKIFFKTLKKRRKLYGNLFRLLGEVRDIDYPPEHYIDLRQNREKLKVIADQILEELYGKSGLFMSYETRSTILKVYQNSYKYANKEIELNHLIDSYYKGRRALREDLEFDDSKRAQSSQKILEVSSKKKEEDSNYKWKIVSQLAYSPRPGYPNKSVSLNELNMTIKLWKKNRIKSIICLLSDEEINEYYEVINYDLIGFYKKNGFAVYHMSITDFEKPPVSEQQLEIIYRESLQLEKPILVHCGAGQDRSGHTVEFLENKLV